VKEMKRKRSVGKGTAREKREKKGRGWEAPKFTFLATSLHPKFIVGKFTSENTEFRSEDFFGFHFVCLSVSPFLSLCVHLDVFLGVRVVVCLLAVLCV